MLHIGVIGSFFGGVLSLLSPCSALLLPAFFAVAFKSRRQILLHGFVFFLGLATLFIPLGLGVGLISDWVTVNRPAMIKVAGGLLILFGFLEMMGVDMAVLTAPLRRSMAPPGAPPPHGAPADPPAPSGAGTGPARSAWSARSLQSVTHLLPTYSLGFVYGFAGICSGPLLGAVLTVAAAAGSPWGAAMLLLVYALGMAAPLLLLASLWERSGPGGPGWLRGKPVSVGPLTFHSTRLAGGALFIIIGVLFIWTGGTAAFERFYISSGLVDVSFKVQAWFQSVDEAVPPWVLGAFLTAAAAVFFRAARRRRRKP